jgi:spermidine synthase
MIFILVFVSGFAGLVYQVLWMKQLGLLFGNTSQAAAVTLAAFFAGLAAGSWFWGRRCARLANPLRTYAWLEVGIALTAAGYFVILYAFHAIYPPLYQAMGAGPAMLGVKFLLALLLVFPPALCMGGTIPVIGQYLIGDGEGRRPTRAFGATAALIYGINTIGAALGALMAGFYLPLWLGFAMTCALAMALTSLAAAGAFRLSRRKGPAITTAHTTASTRQHPPAASEEPAPDLLEYLVSLLKRLPLVMICFLSGFVFLALEVLWTRMFLQVLENSVYTFAAILVISLVCLAAGAGISSLLARLKVAPNRLLAWLMLLSGITIAVTPFIFMHVTNSLQVLALRDTWSSYVLMVFQKGFIAIGPPALVLGTVFPFLMKTRRALCAHGRPRAWAAWPRSTPPARFSARCCAASCFLETFGMWGTMQVLAAAYLVATLVVPLAWDYGGITIRAAGGIALVLLFTLLDPTGLPITSTDPLRAQNEEILETWEGSDCTVAVTRGPNGQTIRINSHYSLGTTRAFKQERLQNDLPLMMYPDTQSIFFLGMGTGITAGGALHPRFEHVQRVVVAELSPHVITAAEKYFAGDPHLDFTGGLFEDPRVTILAEDGRHYLTATRQRFDMVNGDLFVPYRSGVGNLYTREHFRNVRTIGSSPAACSCSGSRSTRSPSTSSSVIARTMLDVFDQVSLWRLHHPAGR